MKPVEEMTVQGNYVASGSILGRVAVYDNTYVAVGDDESVPFCLMYWTKLVEKS